MEASPDLRLQLARFQIPAINHILISHDHFDHMQGLRELHTYAKKNARPVNVYGSQKTVDTIEKELAYLPLQTHVIKGLKMFSLFDFDITPLPLYHYKHLDDAVEANKLANTFGYLVEHRGQRIAYLADYYMIPDIVLECLQGIDIVIADGTYLQTDAYREVKHNHLHGKNIYDMAEKCGASRIYYHSISHVSGKQHDEITAALPANHSLTHDGMRIL